MRSSFAGRWSEERLRLFLQSTQELRAQGDDEGLSLAFEQADAARSLVTGENEA
jgi:hypothetical protein